MSGYRARVLQDASDWQRQTVRLLVAQDLGGPMNMLCCDGLWRRVEDGVAAPDSAGVLLPTESVEAVGDAIAEWQGATSHAATEAKVLREWLEVERGRVDARLGRLL